MVNLLNPGGILLLEIPNKYSFNFVAKDGHFGLFGITLLDRPDAIEYHRTFFDFEYDVGDYYILNFYQREFEARGCKVTFPDFPASSVAALPFREMLSRVWSGYSSYNAAHRNKLSHRLDRVIHTRFAKYLLMLSKDFAIHSRTGLGKRYLQDKYSKDFWTLLVTRT
jgi:hypothetical protein